VTAPPHQVNPKPKDKGRAKLHKPPAKKEQMSTKVKANNAQGEGQGHVKEVPSQEIKKSSGGIQWKPQMYPKDTPQYPKDTPQYPNDVEIGKASDLYKNPPMHVGDSFELEIITPRTSPLPIIN
jgi:hypothetical protein